MAYSQVVEKITYFKVYLTKMLEQPGNMLYLTSLNEESPGMLCIIFPFFPPEYLFQSKNFMMINKTVNSAPRLRFITITFKKSPPATLPAEKSPLHRGKLRKFEFR